MLTYGASHDADPRDSSGTEFRFFGSLEAIQHDMALWLRGGDVTVAADMTHSEIYILPPAEGGFPDEPPNRTTWSRVGSLTEGTRVFVAGPVLREGNRSLMRGTSEKPLLVVFYDGSERDLLRRCIWSGRQLNEYWNPLTPGSLAGGTLALIITAYVLLRVPGARFAAMLSLTLASLPLLPLLPPGVAFFFAYRWSWRRGRYLRAHRDVLRLPLRHLADRESEGVLPDGHLYGFRRVSPPEARSLVELGGTVIRPPLSISETEYTAFGRPGEDGLEMPTDPMTELQIIPGDPQALSTRCQRLARRFELGSAAILGTGLLLNLAGAFIVLQYFVR
jgi:hypothetical protein